MRLDVLAPVSGVVVPLPRVPDPVFAQQFLGPGAAIHPQQGRMAVTALAPLGGQVTKLQAHAYVITDSHGRCVLVHLGLDTVRLGAENFHHHVHQGQAVSAGQAIITWSPARMVAAGFNPIVPVVAMAPGISVESLAAGARVEAGQVLFTWPGL